MSQVARSRPPDGAKPNSLDLMCVKHGPRRTCFECSLRKSRIARSIQMMDVVMLAIGLGFFVLSVGYCYACDRL